MSGETKRPIWRYFVIGLSILLSFSLPDSARAAVPNAPGFTVASLQLVVDNDYVVFMGDNSNVTRLFNQNNVGWPDQITSAAALDITPLNGETYIYVGAMGGGGTEDIGGRLNGNDIVFVNGAQVATGRSPLGTATLSGVYATFQSYVPGYTSASGAAAAGTQDVTLAQMQSALTGATWSSAVSSISANSTTLGYKTSGVCCGGGTTGKGWDFPSFSLVVFRYPVSSLGLPVSAGNGQVVVDWAPPGSGDAPTGYIVQYKRSSDSDATYQTFSSPLAATTVETVTGLTNGIEYSFRVAAINASGTGAFSVVRTATPLGPPVAPTNLSYLPKASSAEISFTDPASNGGYTITNYEYSLNAGSSWSALSPVDTVSPVTIPGLTDGASYQILLRAVNSAGGGVASTPLAVIPGLFGRVSGITFATDPIKSIRGTITIAVNIPGLVNVSVGGKRIPGCYRLRTLGTAPSIFATCYWRPATSGLAKITVQHIPTDVSYASTSFISSSFQVGRRSGTRS